VGAVEPEELEPNTFVFAGRLTRQKALANAIDAVAGLAGARLLVVGDGPERAELERRAGNGRIRFLGAQPRDRVLRLLAGARAAVLPSDWENFPHAAVEALAVGTPLVATAVGGVPEIVEDGVNGLLVPPGSPEALRDALARLTRGGLRDELAGRARASVAALSEDTVYGRLEAILAEAVA
jgi:glycosyltransferase involved in cell wall biosynthesis